MFTTASTIDAVNSLICGNLGISFFTIVTDPLCHKKFTLFPIIVTRIILVNNATETSITVDTTREISYPSWRKVYWGKLVHYETFCTHFNSTWSHNYLRVWDL